MKKGALTHPKQGAGAAPHCVADGRKNTAVSFATGLGEAVGKGGYLLYRGLIRKCHYGGLGRKGVWFHRESK